MKVLVIFYSYENNTAFIAACMARAIDGEILALRPRGEKKHRGLMKFIYGGRQVFARQKPELLPLEKNPAEYDLILLGTPVWAFTYAPPLATFFEQVKLSGKSVGVFCCHGGGKGKTLENMRQQLSANTLLGEIDFVEPLTHDQEKQSQRAETWARQMLQQAVHAAGAAGSEAVS